MSKLKSTSHLQSFVAAEFSGKQNGNLLRVTNSGTLPSLDFKGAAFSPQTSKLFVHFHYKPLVGLSMYRAKLMFFKANAKSFYPKSI